MRKLDAIVIGAGAAGLAAANELVKHGLSFKVIEARGRVGGRIHTLYDARTPMPIELGAEFIHTGADTTHALLREGNLAIHEMDGDFFVRAHGVLSSRVTFDKRMGRAMEAAARIAARKDCSFDEAMRIAKVPADATRAARAFVQGFHAADPGLVSMRELTKEDDDGAGKSFRIERGYEALVNLLAARLGGSLELGARVTEIDASPGDVRIRVSSVTGVERDLRAKAAIVALPLGVLPDLGLPVPEGVEMGHVVKLTLRFREAFWRTDALEKAAFFMDPTQEVPTFWTSRPMRAPVLVAWCGGPPARKLLEQGDVVAPALDSLAAILGVKRRVPHDALEASYAHDWTHDSCARGAYSLRRVGGPQILKARGSLFFAGEHLAPPPNHGTVHGALDSGLRAARALMASGLGPRATGPERERRR